MSETPAETIGRAANLMRDNAMAATCDGMTRMPWRVGKRAQCHCCEEVTDASGSRIVVADDRQSAHIASWDPGVAEAVVGWLEVEAEIAQRGLPDNSGSVHSALRVARAYLREPGIAATEAAG